MVWGLQASDSLSNSPQILNSSPSTSEVRSHKHIMIWEGFSRACFSISVIIDQFKYLKILKGAVLPYFTMSK